MKDLATILVIFLLVIISTGSPILAINLVTSDFMIVLETRLSLTLNHLILVVTQDFKNISFLEIVNLNFVF